MHSWSLQAFSQDYDLVSSTTYIVCINFIHFWWDLQLKHDSKTTDYLETILHSFIYSQSFCQKSIMTSRLISQHTNADLETAECDLSLLEPNKLRRRQC